MRPPPSATLFPYTTLFRSLDQLAERSGVSRRMLVSIEQGSANPSIATLLLISDALGIGLPALVEMDRSPGLRVTRRSEEHTSELQSRRDLVCRLLLEKKKE